MPVARLLSSVALSACLLTGATMGVAPAAQAAPVAGPTPTARLAAPDLKPPLERVLRKVNKARARHDLKPLRATTCLTKRFAQPWARHLADTGTLVHQDITKIPKVCKNLTRAGENIAYGYPTADAVMKAWMASPGHRKNILNPKYTKIGLGLAKSADGTRYWVQDFGG